MSVGLGREEIRALPLDPPVGPHPYHHCKCLRPLFSSPPPPPPPPPPPVPAPAGKAGSIQRGTLFRETDLGPFFEAVVDASEEAVLNSLFMAETVTGRSGHVRYALPADAVREILAQ